MEPEQPDIPEGLSMPYYYASLTNIEVLYLVDRSRVSTYLKGSGLVAAQFGNRACVSLNLLAFTGQLPFAYSPVTELELNIVALPEAQASEAGEVELAAYLQGSDLLGNHRVWVPCDNEFAIYAGEQMFSLPHFKTNFRNAVPSLNDPSVKTWTFSCLDPGADPKAADPATIFTCQVDLQGLTGAPAAPASVTGYGKANGRLVGARWDLLQPYQTYLLSATDGGRVRLRLGSSLHPMREAVAGLIGESPAVAVRTYQSPPVAVQNRAYYV